MIGRSINSIRTLGPAWVLGRIAYELKLKSGSLKAKTPLSLWSLFPPAFKSRFFNPLIPYPPEYFVILKRADEVLQGDFPYFSDRIIHRGHSPAWDANPFQKGLPESNDFRRADRRHWSAIRDFAFGDIKAIWEIGRFSWVYPLVQAFHSTKEEKYAQGVWRLVEDWARSNLPNSGVHWKCGQEIAIRMFAVVTAYFSLVHSDSTGSEQKKLAENIVFESAKRIDANIGYALSQKNNHGISEAAGLFTAGVLFHQEEWLNKGKRLLESQTKDLIYDDGSFSQHSSNYHRLMLHVFLWTVQLGKVNGIEFSKDTLAKIRLAGKWLIGIYDPLSGRTPNLGSNDGALVFPVTGCDYMDYRPTIQAVGRVIDGKDWIASGPWDNFAKWLAPDTRLRESIPTPVPIIPDFHYYAHGGYAVWTHKTTRILFRCPKKFDHRPAQCDLLHVDAFHKGVNILRDAGTYSYNCQKPWKNYFKSTAAHNTIQFDGHDQMPEISRFLYGRWPVLDVKIDGGTHSVEAGFTDWKHCRQVRTVQFITNHMKIIDRLSGFHQNAILRWRLSPEMEWTISRNTCESSLVKLTVHADNDRMDMGIAKGWESLYYMKKTPLEVLEITLSPRCNKVTTEIQFKN